MMTSFTTPTIPQNGRAARARGRSRLLIKSFRLMQTSRRLDDREIMLGVSGVFTFKSVCRGAEAIGLPPGMVVRPG